MSPATGHKQPNTSQPAAVGSPDYVCPTTKVGVMQDRAMGTVYALTGCCKATGKGSADSETDVVCRACYQDVAAVFGQFARTTNHAEVHSLIVDAVTASGCPTPQCCADQAVHVGEYQ